MVLEHESVRALARSSNGYDAASRSLVMSYLDDERFYKIITEGLPIITRAASYLYKNLLMAARFHAPIFFTSAKQLYRKMRNVFLDQCTEFSEIFFGFMET